MSPEQITHSIPHQVVRAAWLGLPEIPYKANRGIAPRMVPEHQHISKLLAGCKAMAIRR